MLVSLVHHTHLARAKKQALTKRSTHAAAYGRRGFTIVELLIVIVVIAILAAITIVSYRGIQSRATAAAHQSDANMLVRLIKANEAGSSTGARVSYDELTTDTGGSQRALNAATLRSLSIPQSFDAKLVVCPRYTVVIYDSCTKAKSAVTKDMYVISIMSQEQDATVVYWDTSAAKWRQIFISDNTNSSGDFSVLGNASGDPCTEEFSGCNMWFSYGTN